MRGRFFGLDLRGKIILMLLVVGALSALGISWLGFQNGKSSLIERITAQIEGRRDISGAQVERYLATARDHVEAMAGDISIREVLRELPAAMTRLNRILPPEGTETGLGAWYAATFVPRLGETGADLDPRAFIPGNYAGRILQALYVSRSLDPEVVPEAQFYAELHDRIDPSMRGIARALGYEDMFLIGPGGRVLYSVLKEPDFATDLETGLYSESGLGRVYRLARGERESQTAAVEDFSFYRPSADVPAIFVAAPVYDEGLFLGYLAVQLSAQRIGAPVEDSAGLGATGDVYVVGADRTLRTEPRLHREDAAAFSAMLEAQGYPQSVVANLSRFGTPIELVEVGGAAVNAALGGETGTVRIERNYQGIATLAAYRPLDIPGLDWTIVAEMPLEEALAPVASLGFQMMVTAAILAIAITFFSMTAARALTRPIHDLIARVNAVLAGQPDVQLAMNRADEYGELSVAMEELARSRAQALEEAETRAVRTEFLLARFLPDAMAREISRRDPEAGEDFNIVLSVPAVTVVYTELVGYLDMMTSRPTEEAVTLLDALVEQIDAAAERAGVEKIRTVGEVYVAASGVSAPRIDHAQRAVAFAEALRETVARFATDSGQALDARIGIATGAAASGIVGRDKLSYELLGPPKFDAIALSAAARPGEIRITEAVQALSHHGSVPAEDGIGLILGAAGS